MSESRRDSDVKFDIELHDGRVAHCWQAAHQPYQDCGFSAGLVSGIDPDVLYLKFHRDGEEPTYLFFRPDELMAVIWCASGALWSKTIIDMNEAE